MNSGTPGRKAGAEMKRNYNPEFGIEKCLNCKAPICNNCLSYVNEEPKEQETVKVKVSKNIASEIVSMWLLGCPIKDIAKEVFLPRTTVMQVLKAKGYVSAKAKV